MGFPLGSCGTGKPAPRKIRGLLTQNAENAGYLATAWAGKSTDDDLRAPDTRLIIGVSSGSMP
jgi:hypothetical protein